MCAILKSIGTYIYDNVEFCALIVSMVSTVFAMGTTVYTIKQANKHKSIELESVYFQDLFLKILLEEIPTARMRISFLNDCLSGDEELLSKITELLKKAGYFRYTDPDFYSTLKEALQSLEDYIINSGNRAYEYIEQVAFKNELTLRLANIYKIISNKYHGR